MIRQFLQLCSELRIPVSLDKTEWSSELMVFLGVLLDGRHLLLALPEDKKQRAIELLNDMKNKKKVTVISELHHQSGSTR